MSLEQLVEVHTNKKHKAVHYSRQATYALALISLVFFGTILGYSAFSDTLSTVTKIISPETENEAISSEESSLFGFVTAVRSSPQVTEIKLLFYTAWTLIVLVGSALWYEIQERKG